MDPLVCCGDG